ncbi:MAG: chromate efflux transporter [Magnetococcus sp. YQC-3]
MPDLPPREPPPYPTFREMFFYWLKLGFISFGGPAGQIAMLHQELVEKRRLISERRFLHALNYCMLLPGPEAQQLCIYLGWMLHRTWGGIVAGTLFILPSLFILSGLTYVYLVFGDLALVQWLFDGIKPAVVAIVLVAAWRIGARALQNGLLWGMAALSFLAIFALGIPFPYIVLGAGLLGMLGGRLLPEKFVVGSSHQGSGSGYGPALLDDDTPPPAHIRFRPLRLLVLLLAGGVLWGGGMLLLGHPVLREMGLFFSKAALVTFGGAYAVLPYVYQGGVDHFHWLSGTQMIDGLALGETTPGPLIMVVAFVGFVGGWSREIFGPEMLSLAGFVGASVATFFTFLPSYLFILAGAPLVESTHGDLSFTAPLTGITAAVVGVILNLALFFGWHVFWPQASKAAPFAGGFAWFAALLSCAALVALWRYKLSIPQVIGLCALLSLLRGVLG